MKPTYGTCLQPRSNMPASINSTICREESGQQHIRFSSVQHSTPSWQHSTAHHSTAQHSTSQRITAQPQRSAWLASQTNWSQLGLQCQ
jgi:hypothetical protein